MKIGITGPYGQLGAELCERLPGAVPLPVDITNRQHVQRVLQAVRPDVVVNAAAYTAVDQAEEEASACYDVNCEGVRNLARETQQVGCRLIHISTDYVFDSTEERRPLREDDVAKPIGVYAKSKLAGELAATENPNSLVVRTCGLYGRGKDGNAKNFVRTMLRLGAERRSVRVVDDQLCNPTSVDELATALEFLTPSECQGVLHVVNSGPVTWFEFAKSIFESAGLDCRVIPITSEEFGAKAPRPAYSALSTRRYERSGAPSLSSCRTAVAQFVEQQLDEAANTCSTRCA